MSAVATLRQAREAGIALKVEDIGLRCRPTPSPELLGRIRNRRSSSDPSLKPKPTMTAATSAARNSMVWAKPSVVSGLGPSRRGTPPVAGG